MEKGTVGDDSARAVGMCDRLLTFLAKNLSMNRQKSIIEGSKNGSSTNDDNHGSHAEEGGGGGKEDDDDEFAIEIEKADFEFVHGEEDNKSITATILEERSTDVVASNAGVSVQKEEGEGGHHDPPVAAEAAAATAAVPEQEKKVKKTVTLKEDSKEEGGAAAAAAAAPSSAVKRLLSKKRQASSSQLGGEEHQKPARRPGLRPRMPSILRVPSNINEKSNTFIEERKKSFGGGGAGPGGKPEK